MHATIRLFRYTLPLQKPLRLGGRAIERREGILVRIETPDGHVGWGDAAPLPGFSRETLDDVMGQLNPLRKLDVSGVLESSEGIEGIERDVPSGLAPSARFAVELALVNLIAAERKVTPAEVLAPEPAREIALTGLLVGEKDRILADAERFSSEGYEAVKLKVGRRALEEDVRLCRAVRERIGPDVRLRLDANRAWSLEEAVVFVKGLDEEPIEYLEEPLARPSDLPLLAREAPVPIALDESLYEQPGRDPDFFDGVAAVILKPTLLGGCGRALHLVRLAGGYGIRPVVSAAFESGVGMAGLVAFAAVLGGERTPAGLDTYRYLATDVLPTRLPLENARIQTDAVYHAALSPDVSLLQEIP